MPELRKPLNIVRLHDTVHLFCLAVHNYIDRVRSGVYPGIKMETREQNRRHEMNTGSMNDGNKGWVACDAGEDTLCGVRHGELRTTYEAALADRCAGGYDYVRWLHTDGYLYVDEQD